MKVYVPKKKPEEIENPYTKFIKGATSVQQRVFYEAEERCVFEGMSLMLSALKEIEIDEDAVLLTDEEIRKTIYPTSLGWSCWYIEIAKAARDKVLEALR